MERQYRIMDAHTHIYPERIAEKATEAVGAFYNLPMERLGSVDALLKSGEEIGVARYVVCSVATTPEQVASINNFIAQECAIHPAFIGLAAFHPHMVDYEAELARVKALGLRGIKFHADFQRFEMDAPHMLPMYQAIAAADLPVLFHMGDARYEYSAPHKLRRVMEQVPELTAIAAHFGGYQRWAEAREELQEGNIYFDTSSSLFALPAEEAVGMIRQMGADRFLFGTDFPMWDHKTELKRFLALPLTEGEREQILYGTFEALYGESG
ncbi:amidohydrolase family protein [Eubacteriales bacterium OttesenSCG-928-M02]|nr:amidohydrolase family protein [Eubacteriales bacterium OttesenSCG-928-M02]